MATYLQPKIRNTVTGQTQKIQDLRGVVYTLSERSLAEEVAVSKAVEFTRRTRQMWIGFVELYEN